MVVFQSSYTLQHGQQLGRAVETLLRGLGFDLSAHLCCGSAGTYSLLQPKLSQRLLQDKVNTTGKRGGPMLLPPPISAI